MRRNRFLNALKGLVAAVALFAMCTTVAFADKKADYQRTYNYQRGVELIQDDKDDEALTYFKKELEDHKDNGYAMVWIASIQHRNEQYGEAVMTLGKAMKCLDKKDEMYAACLILRSKVYNELGDNEKRYADLNQLVKLFPKDPDSYGERAVCYLGDNRCELANADFMKAIELEPGNVNPYVGSGVCLRKMKRYEESIEQYNQALKLSPHFSQALAQRGYSYMKLKRYQEAADDIVKALDEDGNDMAFELLKEMADSAFDAIDFKLKMQQMMEPANYYWPYMRGHVMEKSKRYAKAIEMFEASIKLKYKSVTKRRIAEVQGEMGDFESALITINEALAVDSTNWNLLLEKSYIVRESGSLQEALAVCDRLVELDPHDLVSFKIRAQVKKQQGDIDGAIEDFSMAIMLDKEYCYNYLERGALYLCKGEEALAKADFNQVLKLDTVPSTADCAHYAYHYLGDDEKAVAVLDSCLQHDAESNYYDAACLYSLMNKPERALEYLELALQHGFYRFKHIMYDTDLDNIRELPAFKELIAKYKQQLADKLGTKLVAAADEEVEADYELVVKELPFTHEGGVTKVRCKINDLPLHFVFDTGASDVTISSVEATFMLKNGYLNERDITGKQMYMTADGNISEGTTIMLRKVDFGGFELDDVQASVVKSQKAPLLLGQSVLQRLGKIEIDNARNVLKVTKKVKK